MTSSTRPQHIKKRDVIRWLDNTISVNSVGAVVTSIIEALVSWESVVLIICPVSRGLVAANRFESKCTELEKHYTDFVKGVVTLNSETSRTLVKKKELNQ